MPNWKKLITSGSDASLNSLTVTNGITGSLFGTSSWANNAVSASYTPPPSSITTGSIIASVSTGIGSFSLVSGSSTFMFVSSSGNIGIGTTTPSNKLDVRDSSGNILLTAALGSTRFGGTALFDHNNVRYSFGSITGIFNTVMSVYNNWTPGAVILGLRAQVGQTGDYLNLYSSTGSSIFSVKADGNTLIGTITNDASAILNVTSTTKGFLPPRMTTTQRDAISSPATGLQIYNTTLNTIDIYNGTAWNRFGNSTLVNGTIANSAGAAFAISSGNVGIGTASPLAKLHIVGGDVFLVNNTGSPQIVIGDGIASLASYGGIKWNSSLGGIGIGVGAAGNESIFVSSTSNVGIGTTTPAASAKLEVTSTTKGILIPRMTTTQRDAISSPAQGLLTYVTSSINEGLYYYNSGSYQSWTRTLNDSGSQIISGSLNVTNGITGSLFGTSSWAINAVSASYFSGSISNAITAETASYITSSGVYGPYGANSILSSSYTISASYAFTSTSASYATTASYAINAQNTSDILIYVKNSSGVQIDKGKVVRIAGAVGDNPLIATASYTDDANSANTLGITYENIANDSFGYVITEGTLFGINTDTFIDGQLIYLGDTGSIIGTAPVAPLHAVRLGQVLRSQLNNGSAYIRIDNGYEIGELHDVKDTTTTGSYGDLLVKSGSIWINSKQLTGSYGLTGSLQATSFTGSLFGTASWAINAVSASYPIAVIGSTLRSVSPSGGVGGSTTNSIFLGVDAGLSATSASNSNFLGESAGASATNASNSNLLGASAGFSATNANSSNFLGASAGDSAANASNSNFLGASAGFSATNANSSNFLGGGAGFSATNANSSNFLGESAGFSATNAYNSNFLGESAGFSATNAYNSNFLGGGAGASATNAYNSNFLGTNAGNSATDANNSNFLGASAGLSATSASNSNFLGVDAGNSATSASYSTLIGYQVGFNAAGGALGIKSNNIIIGTNITLPNGTKDSINLGGIIFATGSYATTTGNPSSGSVSGKVGINTINPIYTLDISGSGNYTNGLTVTGSLNVTNGITGSLFGTASWAINAVSSSFATTASYVLNAVSSSFATTASSVNTLNQNVIISGSLTVFTGSAIEFQVTNTGVKIGNLSTDIHTVTGSLNISSSLIITGSSYGNVSAITVASNTASFDIRSANFFTVTMATSSVTHFNVTNPQPGQTVSILVRTNTASTASFSSNIRQVTGSLYTPSISGSNDILTFVTFDSASVFMTSLKRLV